MTRVAFYNRSFHRNRATKEAKSAELKALAD